MAETIVATRSMRSRDRSNDVQTDEHVGSAKAAEADLSNAVEEGQPNGQPKQARRLGRKGSRKCQCHERPRCKQDKNIGRCLKETLHGPKPPKFPMVLEVIMIAPSVSTSTTALASPFTWRLPETAHHATTSH